MIIHNKRGNATSFTGNKVVDLVLAVIVIFLLVFLVVRLYIVYSADTEIRKAKDTMATIEEILLKLSDAPAGENMVTFFLGPDKWKIVYFNPNNINLLPKRCEGKPCLCLCPGSANEVSCNNDGVCINKVYNIRIIADDTHMLAIYSPSSKSGITSEYIFEKKVEGKTGFIDINYKNLKVPQQPNFPDIGIPGDVASS